MRIDATTGEKTSSYKKRYEYEDFYEGMTREKAEKMEKSLFSNPLKTFDKINTDGDDKLSENELRDYEAKEKKVLGYMWAGASVLVYILGGTSKSKSTRFMDYLVGTGDLAMACSNFKKASVIKKGKKPEPEIEKTTA